MRQAKIRVPSLNGHLLNSFVCSYVVIPVCMNALIVIGTGGHHTAYRTSMIHAKFTNLGDRKRGDEKRGDRQNKFVCVCLLCVYVYLSYPPFSHPPFSVLPTNRCPRTATSALSTVWVSSRRQYSTACYIIL